MNPAFLVVQAGKSESVINYKTVIPFEPWMKDARFVLIPNMCGCGKEEQGALLVMADKVLTRPDKRYEVQPTQLLYLSGSGNGKTSCRGGDCLSGLQVGKYAILPDFRNNALELAKIDNTVSTVVNDKNITLEGIILKGFASPEGSYKSNTVLDRQSCESACRIYTEETRLQTGAVHVR